jgi:SAM-dependent methyltransferase
MVKSSTQHYLYTNINEEQRNLLQHNVLRPSLQKMMVEMLENYGLREQLEQTLKTSSQLLILEAGSGSGSFLRDFADLLDEQGLLASANLNGVDLNLNYVTSAEQQNQLKPAWANLRYYQHDITLPLERSYSLKLEKKLEFACICATVLIQYLPNARQHVLNLYHYLKPGGVLYLCDLYMSYDGEHSAIAPNAVMEEFGRIGTRVVRNLNEGKIVAEETASWLREAGAEKVQAVLDMAQTSKGDQRSLEILRYYIALVRSVTPALLNQGLIDQATHDKFLSSVFQVERFSFAQLPFIHTLAQKPVQA